MISSSLPGEKALWFFLPPPHDLFAERRRPPFFLFAGDPPPSAGPSLFFNKKKLFFSFRKRFSLRPSKGNPFFSRVEEGPSLFWALGLPSENSVFCEGGLRPLPFPISREERNSSFFCPVREKTVPLSLSPFCFLSPPPERKKFLSFP